MFEYEYDIRHDSSWLKVVQARGTQWPMADHAWNLITHKGSIAEVSRRIVICYMTVIILSSFFIHSLSFNQDKTSYFSWSVHSWLVGGWAYPSEKWWTSSVGMTTFYSQLIWKVITHLSKYFKPPTSLFNFDDGIENMGRPVPPLKISEAEPSGHPMLVGANPVMLVWGKKQWLYHGKKPHLNHNNLK